VDARRNGRSLDFRIGRVNDDGKLVATKAGDGISGPDAALQAFGNEFQELVASGVAEGVRQNARAPLALDELLRAPARALSLQPFRHIAAQLRRGPGPMRLCLRELEERAQMP